MSKIIQIPSSVHINDLDKFAVKYFDNFFTGKAYNWSSCELKFHQKVGLGTRIITRISSVVKLADGRSIDVSLEDDINLIRIISRIRSRKGSGEVKIEIYKKGEVVVS